MAYFFLGQSRNLAIVLSGGNLGPRAAGTVFDLCMENLKAEFYLCYLKGMKGFHSGKKRLLNGIERLFNDRSVQKEHFNVLKNWPIDTF